jgi:hypothetical protein
MKMPKRFAPEKTTFVNVGGTVIPISTLPEEIASEYALIDKIKEEAAELTYRLEVLSLAAAYKNQQLGAKVMAHLAQVKQEQVDQRQESPVEESPDK